MEEKLLRYFSSELDGPNNRFDKMFRDLANELVIRLPPSAERTFALRKLLEAKDCVQRAERDDVASRGG